MSINRFVDLAKSIAGNLGIEYLQVESKIFPDGETCLRFTENFRNEKIILIHSCFPQQDIRLMELFMMLDAAKDLGAKDVIAVIPYLAYARQDKRFRMGETIGIKTVVKLIEACGADAFLTVDAHEVDILKLFNIKAINLTAMPELGKYLKELDLNKPVVIAPDKGAIDLAKKVAAIIETDCTYFTKTRDLKTGKVETCAKNGDVEGRDAVLIDDMISTGGTIANSANIIKCQGAKKVIAACTHPLLIDNAKKRLKEAGIDEIIGTDTVESDVSKISVANIISEALRAIL